jgi:hypothetical protein
VCFAATTWPLAEVAARKTEKAKIEARMLLCVRGTRF